MKHLIFLLALFWVACSDSESISLKLNEPLRHSDFLYTVTKIEKMPQIGLLKAKEQFYVVHLQVQNEAKRVTHTWDNTVAFVELDGKVYENQVAAQKALNMQQPFTWQDKYVTPANQAEQTVLVFELPNEAQNAVLRYRGEYLIGDMFDGNRFKQAQMPLL